ncbi:mannose-6-phosphate isomerase, class I [Thorsellia anophelis]|uniref:mannose-6-phosphate isomerase n=1 Tax=Thorsellia anophelis DSM 18579 TaxID=1123402 RepID=A0A1I0ETF1_9GAMM|nr:mannose-6-phosphate isomerase, class I [Thorsellia anophelis]SET48831.1 mannose-6-phosphate isomerase, type 1 [Thorsellia anophelis DSM 18579]
MYKLHNTIQNYAWGSKSALTDLFNIKNTESLPMAEIWMGAHPKSSSKLISDNQSNPILFSQSMATQSVEPNNMISLRDYLAENLEGHLGIAAAKKFGELPFLFKVLCANEPLSIQVHPNRDAAIKGFKRENDANIPLDSPIRDYKDPNHKPELIYALTDFIAMNAFRTLDDISELLTPLSDIHPLIKVFLTSPSEQALATLFEGLLKLEGDEKLTTLAQLKHTLKLKLTKLETLSKNHHLTWQTLGWIAEIYPEDAGLFAPLLLNVVQLKPGEAMFLYANTPHAYLNGTGLEIMANSDNVLRAGLTPKNINLPELMANLEFMPKPINSLLMKANREGMASVFPIPVDDFAFAIHTLKLEQPQEIKQTSAAIYFCIKGQIEITNQRDSKQIQLNPGESCFISLLTPDICISGEGVIAQAYYPV